LIEAARKTFEAQHGPLSKSNRALWDQRLAAIRDSGGGQTPPGYGPTDMSDDEQGDGQAALQVIQWLEKSAHADQPFFIGWGLQRPHIPHWVPQKYFNLYPLDALHIQAQPANDLSDVPPEAINPRYALYGKPTATEAKRREVTAAYYACVSFIDAQIGRVLQALDRLGLADRTIVVVTGDHGYLLGEHGLWEKSMLFEPAARIPLLVRVPNVTQDGAACSRIVEFVDLFPTLAELCQVKTPENLEGLSFVPLLRRPDQAWKKAAFTAQRSGKVLGQSVRTERWRYTEWGSPSAAELYDEEKDPGEFTNQVANPAYAAQVRELREFLRADRRRALPPETIQN
jgi:iduronate 2-sulfatase